MVEAPITISTICIIVLVVMQLGIWFRAYLMVHVTSADLCRIVAVDDAVDRSLLVSYAYDRMQALGAGSAQCIKGSLAVDVQGTKRGSLTVTVSLRQTPLPLIRTISGGLVPAAVVISRTSQVRGTYHDVQGEPAQAPYRFGNVTP